MTTKERWDKSGATSIRQRIEDSEKTLTREFNFAEKTIATIIDRKIGTKLSYKEAFDDGDGGLIRTAWEEMQRVGVPDTLDFELERTKKERHLNADAVANVFKKPRSHDTVAPAKAAFRTKKS